jgi:hypothetical protein
MIAANQGERLYDGIVPVVIEYGQSPYSIVNVGTLHGELLAPAVETKTGGQYDDVSYWPVAMVRRNLHRWLFSQ